MKARMESEAVVRTACERSDEGVTTSIHMKDTEVRIDTQTNAEAEERAMCALWNRRATQNPRSHHPQYNASTHHRLRSVTPLSINGTTATHYLAPPRPKTSTFLHAVLDIANPCSSFWLWGTRDRFAGIAELLTAFPIGWKEIATTVVFLICLNISSWLF